MQKIILSSLLLFSLILLDNIYGKMTFELSNSITEYLQQQFDYGNENGLIESFLLIFQVLGGRQFMGMLFIILWLKSGLKEQILKLITMYSITAFLGHFTKMILVQPRPFYEETDVRLDFCQKGYGDPSDNALRSVVFYVILSETLLFKKYKVQVSDLGVLSSINQDKKLQYQYKQLSNDDLYTQLYPNTMLSYNQYKLMLATFLFITGISNSYFGLNYLSQVIMGWIIGGYILYIYYFCDFEKQLERLFIQAIYNQSDQLHNKLRHVGKLALLIAFPILISIILYIIRINDIELIQQQEEWGVFFLSHPKCENKVQGFNMSFEKQEIIGICIIFLPFYLYFCCYFTHGQYKPDLYNHQTFTLKGLVRVLILVGLLISQVAIHIFIRKVVMSNNLEINITYLIIGQLFLEFYFSFLLITLLPLLYKLCKADIDGDFLRKINQIEMQEMEL
ncbi:unnamed protein product [Paramecium pentaurelia]|uniref:Phosphatidic acid phosphatase type 2/haloperoxidase domain-containing protein n=1 Tax=Paramecium pentaurelia TaxID=43138 RepID=A0A8S1YH97_9CILI|nr:unnamed protein product [Paramecium pentaurelia]